MNLKRNNFHFEVCAGTIASCLAAQEGGADRVELCTGLSEGGLTPSFAMIELARNLLQIKLHVIIRPRGGDFLYSPLELDIMEKDIQNARRLGADGVVFGCLNKKGDIDKEATLRLRIAADDMSTTFHRAFDCCRDPYQSIEQLIEYKFDRILTSGQESSAAVGIPMLRTLHKEAKGRIQLLAGCGVNEENIVDIYTLTNIEEYHFSARENHPSIMRYHNRNIFMGISGVDEYSIEETSAKKVQRTIHALTSIF